MDEIAGYNLRRWEALAEVDALWTRPYLDLDAERARTLLDPQGRLGDLTGTRVLCLASGGGQQSACFALLGARVTVLDRSPAQLRRDRQAAIHYGYAVETVEGDMRDLGGFAADSFAVVWHPYSLNFVPDAAVVFAGVARALRPGGLYHLMCANPLASGIGTRDWTGDGYLVRHPYVQGTAISYPDEAWAYGEVQRQIEPPREYRHTLATLINGLAGQGFVLEHLEEEVGDAGAPPGSWEHLKAVVPPWLRFWAILRQDLPGCPTFAR